MILTAGPLLVVRQVKLLDDMYNLEIGAAGPDVSRMNTTLSV